MLNPTRKLKEATWSRNTLHLIHKRSRIKSNFFKKDELIKYKSAITVQIIKNFISIMSKTTNNEKTMLHGFHRSLYIKKFVEYIQANIHKYDL